MNKAGSLVVAEEAVVAENLTGNPAPYPFILPFLWITSAAFRFRHHDVHEMDSNA
jgi:hypothetical protein